MPKKGQQQQETARWPGFTCRCFCHVRDVCENSEAAGNSATLGQDLSAVSDRSPGVVFNLLLLLTYHLEHFGNTQRFALILRQLLQNDTGLVQIHR
mmetsp:Transcript_28965/g.62373  ORF Transcript_28965/g.62373 Transcript_28965/m.62373 type:complete len:96 (+) Transcript_28965:362-649(+)